MFASVRPIIAIIGLASATAASARVPSGVTAFVRDHKLTRYRVALSDLNNDGHPEALIYAMAMADGGGQTDLCGSGGCDLYILSLTRTGYRVVTTTTITQLPIRVLASISHGWHDLGVQVAGGGIIPGYEARLRFDGHRYPSNPSVPPAIRLKGSSGKVLIKADPPVG
jgi:hypothetical protein